MDFFQKFESNYSKLAQKVGQLTSLTCVMTCWKYKHKGTILTRFSNWRWHWMAVSYSNRKIYTIFRVSKHRSFEQGRSCWGYKQIFWVKKALEDRLFFPNKKNGKSSWLSWSLNGDDVLKSKNLYHFSDVQIQIFWTR